MSDAPTKILFCGHTHLPFLAELIPDKGPDNESRTVKCRSIRYNEPIPLGPGEYIINPGSIGHPRDGDPRISFALFEPDDHTVEFRRHKYDTRPVVDGLKQERYGYPSEHENAARYLVRANAAKLREDEGIDLDLEHIPRRLVGRFDREVQKAYERLILEIETADGGETEQNYHAKVYRVPEYDLEAVES